MILLSCAYCSFNGLQHGPLGLSVGYCVEHRVVLRRADETTCKRHLRKDLARDSREAAHAEHKKRFLDVVQFIASQEPAEDATAIDSDASSLEADAVGEAVAEYGLLDSKIATLAQLNQIPGVRAESAMLSLGRGFVRRCVQRGGAWTSGLHVLWWTRKRLATSPAVSIADFRLQTAASIERQFELAAWSIVMLRLHFISDVAASAPSADGVWPLADLVEKAAEATGTPDLNALLAWIGNDGEPLLRNALPRKRYEELRAALHKDDDGADAE